MPGIETPRIETLKPQITQEKVDALNSHEGQEELLGDNDPKTIASLMKKRMEEKENSN